MPETLPNFDSLVDDNAGTPAVSAPAPAGTPAALPDFDSLTDDSEKYGTTGEQAKAALEGLARGASFGTSDLAEMKLFGVKPEDIKGRMEANPVTSTGAQIVGGIAPLALTGGVTLPEEAAAALGPVATRAVTSGLEGAAFGAGNAVTDAALGDPNITAQKVLTDVGMGAAFGSGLGLLSKGIEAAVPKATKRLVSALGSLKEATVGTEENPSFLVKAASVPGSVASGESPAAWIQAFYDGINQPESKLTVRSFVDNLGDIHESGEKAAEELAGAVESYRGDELQRNGLDPFTKKSMDVAQPEIAEQNAGMTGALDEYEAARKNFKSAFMRNDEVDPSKVQSFFNRFNDVSQDLKKNYLAQYLESAQNLAKATENFSGFTQGEESISDHISSLADKNRELSELAETLKSRAARSAPEMLRGLSGDVVRGTALHALGVPSPVIGAGLAALDAYKAIKNPFEAGAGLENTFHKLKAIGDISEKVGDQVGSLSKSVFAIPAARAVPESSLVLASNSGYDRKTDRVQELAENPEILMKHLDNSTAALYEAAPNVSTALHQTMIRAVQYLNSKIPRPQNERLLAEEWEPSATQKEKFLKAYGVVDNPLTALKELRHGTLDGDTMEALQTVYPQLLDHMRRAVAEHMTSKKGRALSYGTKIALSKFMGEPLDDALLPQNLAQNQASLSGPQLSQQSVPRETRTTLGGLKLLKNSSRAATELRDSDEEDT